MSTLNPKPLEPNSPITWTHYPAKGKPVTRTGTVWAPASGPAEGTTRTLWVIPDTHLDDDLYYAIPVGRARTDNTPVHGKTHADAARHVEWIRHDLSRFISEGNTLAAENTQKSLDATMERAQGADLHTVAKGDLYGSSYTDSPLGLMAASAETAAQHARDARTAQAAA